MSNTAKEQKLKEYMSADQAADYLGVHKNTLYKLAKSGDLVGYRVTAGSSWRFEQEDLDQFILDQKYKKSQG